MLSRTLCLGGVGFLDCPALQLRLQVLGLLLQTLTRLLHIPNLCFNLCDIGVGLIELTLRFGNFILEGVLLCPHRFELGFGMAQFCGLLF